MWTRSELKAKGKASFMRFFGGAVLACLLLSTVIFMMQDRRDDQNLSSIYDYEQFFQEDGNVDFKELTSNLEINAEVAMAYKVVNEPAFIIFAILIVLARYLIYNPLDVGVRHYFMRNRDERTRFGAVFYGFKASRYFHICKIMFIRDLYITLWTLLLIIPGLIKGYEYRMIPYILAENSDLSSQRVFALSKEMMTKNKFDTFVLDLSYFLWFIGSTLTLGMLSIFFIDPYMMATEAELYAVLRHHVLSVGSGNSHELHGFYAS